jgi:hypothetical protein
MKNIKRRISVDRRAAAALEIPNPLASDKSVSQRVHFAALDRPLDREDRNSFVRRIVANLPIELGQSILAALVMKRDHFPICIKDWTSGASLLRRRSVMDARYARNLLRAAERPLMIKKLIILKRESQVLPAGIPDDVNLRVVLNRRQGRGKGKRGHANRYAWEPQYARIVVRHRRRPKDCLHRPRLGGVRSLKDHLSRFRSERANRPFVIDDMEVGQNDELVGRLQP